MYFISVYLFSLGNEEAALVSFSISFFFFFVKDTESQDLTVILSAFVCGGSEKQTMVGEISNIVLDLLGW